MDETMMDETMAELAPLRDEDATPALFRWGGLVLGVILFSDAIRRFFIPGSRWDLYGFLIYLFLGGFCLIVSGYRRAFLLNERGLVRETALWGRSVQRLLLSWEAVTDLSWDADASGEGCVRIASPGVAWRLRLRGGQESGLIAWVRRKRPDLEERLAAGPGAEGQC